MALNIMERLEKEEIGKIPVKQQGIKLGQAKKINLKKIEDSGTCEC